MRRGVSYACVVCDDLDFDSLLVEERRGEEGADSVLLFVDLITVWLAAKRDPKGNLVDTP
jgi:hypothetical protein